MKPNIDHHNPDPAYLRSLIEKTGFSQTQIAKRIGIQPRTMRRYITDKNNKSYLPAPYIVQFAIECLAQES